MSFKEREPASLNQYASHALEWETRILVLQAAAILRVRPTGQLGEGFPNHLYDGVHESWLIHIRLLDDFLGQIQSGGKGDPVIARHWDRAWRSTGFLDDSVRKAINAQLAHLDWQRDRWSPQIRPPWEPRFLEITDACFVELVRFFDFVRRPELQEGFGAARARADWWLSRQWLGEPHADACVRLMDDCIIRSSM